MSSGDFNFSLFSFHPVIELPESYDVYDFTEGYDPERARGVYGVGKYNEKRAGMYTTELFSPTTKDARNIHIGIDIAAPRGAEVFAFYDGEIFSAAINAAAGDYGGTVITQHDLGGRTLWALHGHLSHQSVIGKKPGQPIKKGEVIAWLGSKEENGGWNPHLHFQLSWVKPEGCDMPGVVTEAQRESALRNYPDPRLILGPLY